MVELRQDEWDLLLDVLLEVEAVIEEDDIGLFSPAFVRRFNELALIVQLDGDEVDDSEEE